MNHVLYAARYFFWTIFILNVIMSVVFWGMGITPYAQIVLTVIGGAGTVYNLLVNPVDSLYN